ncbi:MAG: UvrD-helicase domain-containing protein [Bacteroidales bacterium]|nr:UvrD-helicase domain-containing protein [Bacteroidales bacterium]
MPPQLRPLFTTYTASAGAGKTPSLVAEYLSICLKDEKSLSQYRHILAVTFTNNATAEMKDRIVQTLNKFAFEKRETWGIQENAIFDKILEANPHLIKEEGAVVERSRKLLAEILYDYSNFSISTIDSFFQRIVRAFAFELGISMGYEVEVSLDECFSQCVDMLLNRLSADNTKLKECILGLVNEQMGKNGRWRVENTLLEILSTIFGDETAAIPLAALAENENINTILLSLQQKLSQQRRDLEDLARKAAGFWTEKGLTPDNLNGGETGIWACFNHFDVDVEKPYKNVYAVLDKGGIFVKSGELKGTDIDQQISELFHQLRNEQAAYLKKHTLLGNVKKMMLIFDLMGIMDEIRERDNKFFLSDTNYKINSEVNESDTPFIYEKIGNKYRHFFIDEFQDTSRMQWENLLPLLQNALSFPDGQAILFGDVKQAIYRFRNGDSKLLNDLSQTPATQEYNKLIPGDGNCDRRKSVLLDTNFRSFGNIVEFNNLFFEKLPQLPSFKGGTEKKPSLLKQFYSAYYQDVRQKINPDFSGKGAVCLHFMNAKVDKETYFCEKVVAAVKDAVSAARGFHQRDIAVLTSGNKEGSMLGRELTKAGFSVISPDSLLLSTSPEVNLIIAALRYVVNDDDILSRFAMANYVLLKNRCDIAKALGKDLENLRHHKKFTEMMNENGVEISWSTWNKLPLFSLLTEILKAFGITESNAFVVALIDNALDYLKNKNGELFAFLDWWDTKGSKLAIKSPQGLDAITISTIHRSKGLQYPVVIVPFTQYNKNKLTKGTYWHTPTADDKIDLPYLMLKMNKSLAQIEKGDLYDEEVAMTEMDSLNKIYVAQTRAKKLMHIITGRMKKDSVGGNYNNMLDEFVQLGEKEKWPLRFVQDPNDELCFWWGDPTVNNNDEKVKMEADGALSAMYCAGFNMKQLSTHINKTETTEQAVGNAVHDYLSKLTHFPQTMGEAENWELPAEQLYVDEIKAALKFIAGSEQWKPYFADGLRVLNEVPILPTKAILNEDNKEKASRPSTTYRPDRIVLLENETVVIDYKTGHPTEDVKEKYSRQVEKYVDLLKAMGLPDVKGRIMYIEGF